MIELVALLSLFAAAVSEETAVRRRGDGAGVLVTDGRRVFLLRRSRKVHEPGTWGIPGGGIGLGEVPLLAAMREVEEEVGELPAGRLLAGRVTLPIPGSGGERSFTTFAWLTTPDRLDAWTPELNWEHDDYAVVELERAASMDLHPGLAELLSKVIDGSSSRSGVLLPAGWRCNVDVRREHICATLKDERGVHVGEVTATSPVDGTDRLYMGRCHADLEALRRRVGVDIGALIVSNSSVTPRYQGKGFGLYLYERVLLAAAEMGFALAPAGCDEGRTSPSAYDTWERLAKLYPSEGSVVWGEGDVRRMLLGNTLSPSTEEWPTRLDMDRLAASMSDQMGEEVAEAERELPNFSFREDFDADEFFSRWAAQEPRLEYLGSGTDRAVFRTDRGVLKIGYGGGGIDQNLSEALVWKEAPDELRPHLVPVLDAASGGEWLLAEYAEVSNEDLPYDLLTAVWGFGLEDLVPGNATKDGRLLDYGTVNWDKWVKIVPDTDAFR